MKLRKGHKTILEKMDKAKKPLVVIEISKRCDLAVSTSQVYLGELVTGGFLNKITIDEKTNYVHPNNLQTCEGNKQTNSSTLVHLEESNEDSGDEVTLLLITKIVAGSSIALNLLLATILFLS